MTTAIVFQLWIKKLHVSDKVDACSFGKNEAEAVFVFSRRDKSVQTFWKAYFDFNSFSEWSGLWDARNQLQNVCLVENLVDTTAILENFLTVIGFQDILLT